MTLALDTTALLARFLSGAARRVAVEAMSADGDWCASALALAEALTAVERLDVDVLSREDLRGALHDDWQRMHVVPVDDRCLQRAASLGIEQPIRVSDAIHLAAAERLPRPLTFCTFEPSQIPVALAMGFDVVSI